jgi:hypothetical protein
MRLWTIHPRHLDTKGLLAVWREGLLAQKVLKGETRGYRNHPQLVRFKTSPDPLGAIAEYLRGLQEESVRRGYKFSGDKIEASRFDGKITCTRGQVAYEWEHLKRKLKTRDAGKYFEAESLKRPDTHPLFSVIKGDVEEWEKIMGRVGRN